MSYDPKKQRLAWIGLGNMGRGMASNIATKAGLHYPLAIFNRTEKRSHDFATKVTGVTISPSIESAVESSDIIFTSMGDDASLVGTFKKALSGDVKGKLFVETSTVLPETVEKLAKLCEEKGAGFLASPVFGAPAMADAGKLVVILSGKGEDIDRVLPYCDGVISRATVPMRDANPGKAQVMKLMGNSFVVNMVNALAEGHVFAEKTGLGSEYVHQFLESMFGATSPYIPYSKRMMTGDYVRDEPLFAVDLARKDAGHIMKLAKDVGVEMTGVEAADQRLKDLKEIAGPSGDLPGIYGAVRAKSGLSYNNQEKK